MPPRFTFWTIIIDGQPTAFRAASREELLPTLKQLQAKNRGADLKWFARGRVWESPEEARRVRAEQEAAARAAAAPERRGREWRPGGEHRDPRERFKRETFQAKKRRERKAANLARGERPGEGRPGAPSHDRRGDRPRDERRPERRSDARQDRPAGRPPKGAPHGFRPQGQGHGRPGQDPPKGGGFGQPHRDRPQGSGFGRPRQDRPQASGYARPAQDRPRGKNWGGGARAPHGGTFGRPPRETGWRPPFDRAPKPPDPADRVAAAAAKPAEPARPAPPVERVTPATTKPAESERPTPPVDPGTPAPAHETKLPRLRRP